MKKILLVFAPIAKRYLDARTHFGPSLTTATLATYIEDHLPDSQVKTLDGVLLDTDEIITIIDRGKPDVVGISIQLISYSNALKIAQAAKSTGARTVFGGHQATQLHSEIMQNRHQIVDAVIRQDGETALLEFCKGTSLSEIPNVTYYNSQDGMFQANDIRLLDLNSLPITRYDNVDFTPYDTICREEFDGEIGRYMRMYSHKGCGNRARTTYCGFCGRADIKVRFKTPKKFWDEILFLQDRYGADFIFDVGDDFLMSTGWLESVANTRPKNLTAQIGIFGRANRINRETASLLSQIGVVDVTIGFETGNQQVLAASGKHGSTTPDTNLSAATSLYEVGIDTTASYVLGLPGETKFSIQETVENAEQLVELSQHYLGRPPRELVANLLEPSPGSPIFKTMVKHYPDRYRGQDFFSLESLQKDYFMMEFNLRNEEEYKELRRTFAKYGRKIHGLVGFADAQGWLNDENIYG